MIIIVIITIAIITIYCFIMNYKEDAKTANFYQLQRHIQSSVEHLRCGFFNS